jgi:hypothetical protein
MSKVALSAGENSGTYSRGGWVSPRADLNELEKRISSVPVGIRTPDRPSRRHRKVVTEYSALWNISTQVAQLSKVLQKLWVSEIINKLSDINNETRRFIIVKNTVFWCVTPCSFVNVKIYQELTNSIFSSTLKPKTASSSAMQFKFQMDCPFSQHSTAQHTTHTHTHTHTQSNNVSPSCETPVSR